MGEEIRESPYEPGLYFVPPEPGTTMQSIGTQQWKVGSRYTLIRVLGYGSFSAVCLARDNATGEEVALKRIADVLQSPEQAKRVLREICTLRRLAHPNVVAIRDCFTQPSATGQYRLIQGRLVNTSVDVYLAMEYAGGGDLFHLRGQLSAEEVRSMMWQLLHTVKWLHSLHIWHRDLKTQNVFLIWEHGERVIKIGDFGSARSAIPQGYQTAEQAPPNKVAAVQLPSSASGPSKSAPELHESDSFKEMSRAMQPSDIYVQYETPRTGSNSDGRSPGAPAFRAPLTRVVCTPCYRAPEVVMSRGGYTSALDMWSLGCIFGELLSRIAHVGSAATPNLQVAPLFAITGMPKTPEDGECFTGGPGCSTTRRELQALFTVIGSPAWADVAQVPDPAWRQYLQYLPGKAPMLYRRFRAAGEEAVDLLSRLLAFDPNRRCSAEEALCHEYFAELAAQTEEEMLSATSGSSLLGSKAASLSRLASSPSERSTPQPPQQQQQAEAAGVASALGTQACTAAAAAAAAGAATNQPMADAEEPSTSPAALASTFAAAVCVGGQQEALAGDVPCSSSGGAAAAAAQQQRGSLGQVMDGMQQYWDESNPGRALGVLEDVLQSLTASCSFREPSDEGSQRLRRLLEAECEEIAVSHGGSGPSSGGGGSGVKRPRRAPTMEGGILSGLLDHKQEGLQVDSASGGGLDTTDYGRQRLSNVADTWQGKETDISKILVPDRHGEWTDFGSDKGPAAGPRWGVSALPPGMDEASLDPKMREVVRAQQLR